MDQFVWVVLFFVWAVFLYGCASVIGGLIF